MSVLRRVELGLDNRETIVKTVGAVRYMASSSPGADPDAKEWVCSKHTIDGDVEKLNVLPGLRAPGVDGAGLAALFEE